MGWLKDFNDPQSMLDPTFNGDEHRPGEQLELAAARRAGDQQGDRRGQARRPTRRSAPRRGPTRQRRSSSRPRRSRDLGQPGEHRARRTSRGVINKFNANWDLDVHLAEVGDRGVPDQSATAARRHRAAGRPLRSHHHRHTWPATSSAACSGIVLLLIVVSAVIFVIFNVFPSADPAALRAGRQPRPSRSQRSASSSGSTSPCSIQFWTTSRASSRRSTSGTELTAFNFGHSYQSNADVRT